MPPESMSVLVSVIGVSLVSVVGAITLLGRGWIKPMLPLLVALAAGAMLGDTFLHLLPEAVAEHGGFTPAVSWGVLGGVLGFFLIEGMLHWHHHGEDVHEHGPGGVHSIGWMNLLGDMLHNTIDGILIASAWLVSEEAGIATTIAVLLHEIPQELGDFGVLLHAGFSPKRALFFNLLSGLFAVLGALVVLLAPVDVDLALHIVPIAAGGFIYVACADLVPEIRKRARGWKLAVTCATLLFGVSLVALVHELGIGGHSHDHSVTPHEGHDPDAQDGHDHDDHDEHEGHDHK